MNKSYTSFAGLDSLVGWYGTGAILLAYALVSFGIMKVDSLTYQILNLTGALGMIVISLIKKAYQPAILNIVWSVVAIAAIVGILLR